MANTINTIKNGPGLFAKGMAQHVKDNLKFCSFVDQAEESDYDGVNGHKNGDTIYTNIPAIKTVQRDNFDITSMTKDSKEGKAPLVLDKSATATDQFDSLELATDIDVKNALKRFGMSSALAIAHDIESRCLEIASDATYQSTGTAGSNTFDVSDILDARTALSESLAPEGNRALFMNSRSGAKAVDARKGLFQSSEEIAKQYRQGYVGTADGFDWIETQLIPTHTNGNDVTGVAINGTIAEGASSITVDGLTTTTGTVTKGTVFTIAGVNKVHPQTKADYGELQQFVVTADVTASGTGTATLSISPAIYAGSDGLQNVTALPADNAALVFVGAASATNTQNLALHSSAFKMVTVPLYSPTGEEMVASETVDGITVNIVRGFDINTRKVTTRYDVLYAFAPVRAEWSNRITA